MGRKDPYLWIWFMCRIDLKINEEIGKSVGDRFAIKF
jgi:hypothetical protein